jgi:RNA polymerase sigma-54 factor
MQELYHHADYYQAPLQTPTTHLVITTELLAMSTAELQQELTTILTTNPALELVEDRFCPHCNRPLERFPCPYCQQTGSTEIYEVPPDSPDRYRSSRTYDDEDWEPQDAKSVTLAEYAWEQLAPALEADEHEIGSHLVERLDEHGYLREPPAEIAAYLNQPLNKVKRVIHKLHQIEPAGIGAPDARTCLLIQLDHMEQILDQRHPLAAPLIDNAWDHLVRGDITGAAAAAGCTTDEVHQTLEYIQKNLHPRPAELFWQDQRYPAAQDSTRLDGPDVLIRRAENDDGTPSDRLIVELYTPPSSWLRVDASFKALAQEARANANGDGPPEWAALVDRASLFIKCLRQRNATMKAMLNHLVDIQRDYILYGDRYHKPLTRAHIARHMDVHESTISRAVGNKTIALPNGQVVELRKFFDRSLSVRDRIREFIENEDANHPLSDRKIANRLQQEGIDVARRTVAKYRDLAGILPAHLRHKRLPGTDRWEAKQTYQTPVA